MLKGKLKSSILTAMLGAGMLLAGCSSETTQPQSNTETPQQDAPSAEANIGDQVNFQLIGIDPGAGLMKATAQAIEDYGLADWELVEGSGAAMTAALTKAYENQEPIIVTGWTPHWKFAKYDLKYLEDPKGIFGADEDIHTIARLGLKDDHPSAHAVLDKFHWSPDDMAEVMVSTIDGKEPVEAAEAWIAKNESKVNEWVEGVEPVQGDQITLAYVAWDSEIASTHVVAAVLEQVGYKVELSQVEAGPMWAGVAGGDADAIVAAWLPTTHADYYQQFDGQFEDLGANLKGTKIGLVVPSYMEINSIEDLK
ncbi:glycine betaine ABC transporter substrate-binding protein [Ammoniphilus sp. CFH 90114]|uniref:glycine betaine ABC transporter substrate-binding protein n=1 Tax=Ammoniphilus sp. CFH 90114 TaxID=2493665 RepID=UPI00100FDC15|nr:glycine betaine ABC transporter substrate-binding protein [Ammoniphilus sp. CFH 90114]RXT15373.1 glycine/betaine ABC transporter [Ammoniphilus sp. CFH 90114]